MTRTEQPTPGPVPVSPEVRRTQRRVIAALVAAQAVGGIGIGSALAVGSLIATDIAGSETWAGMPTTMVTVGAAVCALPLAAAAARRGRRLPLSLGWFLAAAGGLVAITATQAHSFGVFLLGMVMFGSGTATNLQARHAAADLADDRTRGRDLSVVVWATTVGSVTGPNLITPGRPVAQALGLDPLLGPFVFATAAFALAGLLTSALLRPDPLLTARTLAAPDIGTAPDTADRGAGLRRSFAAVGASRDAMLAMAAIIVSHAVMVMAMTMTPVHMEGAGAGLTVIGVTVSLHIAGMYALSPLVGWIADRFGRVPTLLVGQAVLLLATAVSALAGHDTTLITVGMALLGVGWSFGLVAGSALLAESLRPEARPGAQGLSDLLMNAGGAACGALSGVVVFLLGFGGLNIVAAAVTIPVVAFTVSVLLTRRP